MAQSPKGLLVDYQPLQTKDTLKITSWYGDFWFGFAGSGMFNQYIGTLYMPIAPEVPPNSDLNPEFPITGGSGGGLNLGLAAEWNEPGSIFGGIFRAFYSNFTYSGESDVVRQSDGTVIKPNSTLSYFNMFLGLRYNIDFLSSEIISTHLYAGPGLELNIAQTSQHVREFQNTGNIEQFNRITFDNLPNRVTLTAGLGIDLFLVDLKTYRMRFSPFAEINLGSNIIGKQNNGINDAGLTLTNLRLGFSVKFGKNNMIFDTLKFDPNYRDPEMEYVELENKYDVAYLLKNEVVASQDLAYIPLPVIVEAVREEPVSIRPVDVVDSRPTVTTQRTILPNKVEYFYYDNSAETGVQGELKAYLDKIAKFMVENPRSEVRIVGHSDNVGTPEENQRRSEQRATRIVRYLMSKGIDRYRLLDRGEGARSPIGDVMTAEGRKRNRRVEITVVQ